MGPLGPLGPLVPFAASPGDRKVPGDEWVVRVFDKKNPQRWSVCGARGNVEGGVNSDKVNSGIRQVSSNL